MRSNKITRLLRNWGSGKTHAFTELIEATYPEIRKLAAGFINRENHHLNTPTEMAHDVILRLKGHEKRAFENRNLFFANMLVIMRNLCIDASRKRKAQKRDAILITQCSEEMAGRHWQQDDHLALEQALENMSREYPNRALIVHLRFYGGFKIGEIALLMKMTPRSVEYEWYQARDWLKVNLSGLASDGLRDFRAGKGSQNRKGSVAEEA